MMEIKKILWPNDFTPTAHRVLPFVESLVETYGASLHLLHVAMDLSRYGGFYGKPTPEHVKGMHDFVLEGAKKKLADFCEDELASCSTYEFHVRLGDPGEEILKASEELEIDLIVMPVRSGERAAGLGSIAQKVLRETTIPVLVITP
jgi:nucleotide-binding universal stress UspA family protein